jgi:hypothetical protein
LGVFKPIEDFGHRIKICSNSLNLASTYSRSAQKELCDSRVSNEKYKREKADVKKVQQSLACIIIIILFTSYSIHSLPLPCPFIL